MAEMRTWMPLYWGDYSRDTGNLNALMHGAYLMLLRHYWCTGLPLPDDDDELWRTARCDSLKEWQGIRPKIAKLFQIGDGLWRHKRVEKELAKSAAISEAKAKAGTKGSQKRWGANGKPIAPAIAEAQQEQSQTDNHSHLPSEEQSPTPPNPRKRGALSAEQLSEFEGWYERYPHKVGRGAAEKAWTSARAIASLVELSEGLTRYVASKRPDVPWCNPATWLNTKRWMDAPAEPAPPKPAEVISAADRDAAKAKWNGRLAEFRDTGLWQTAWGEPPWTGNNGCFTPPWIKDAFLATRKTRQEAFALPDNLRRVPVESDDAAALASRYEELTQRRTG